MGHVSQLFQQYCKNHQSKLVAELLLVFCWSGDKHLCDAITLGLSLHKQSSFQEYLQAHCWTTTSRKVSADLWESRRRNQYQLVVEKLPHGDFQGRHCIQVKWKNSHRRTHIHRVIRFWVSVLVPFWPEAGGLERTLYSIYQKKTLTNRGEKWFFVRPLKT